MEARLRNMLKDTKEEAEGVNERDIEHQLTKEDPLGSIGTRQKYLNRNLKEHSKRMNMVQASNEYMYSLDLSKIIKYPNFNLFLKVNYTIDMTMLSDYKSTNLYLKLMAVNPRSDTAGFFAYWTLVISNPVEATASIFAWKFCCPKSGEVSNGFSISLLN